MLPDYRCDMYSLNHEITRGKLVLSWHGKGEYHSEVLFEWRGLLIHLKFDVKATYKATTETVTIVSNNESFSFGIGRCSLGGGRFGKQPRIETSTHYLSFIQGIKRIMIIDNLKNGAKSDRKNDIIFKIIKPFGK